MLIKIIIGLLGLGIVVFIHELGHFLMAKICRIDVEAFSVGWGKPIWKKNIRGVEYRIGIIPAGGYCQMRGEHEFQKALHNKDLIISKDPNSFYGAHPFKRILVALAGPAFNILFAIFISSLIWINGFTINAFDNKVILASEVDQNYTSIAELAGIKTGDRIISINGNVVDNSQEVQEYIATNAGNTISVNVDRNGFQYEYSMVPELDKTNGAGRIGVYFWTDPEIASVERDSASWIAGIKPGDKILSFNDTDIPHTVALYKALSEKPQFGSIKIYRNNEVLEKEILLSWNDNGTNDLGINFRALEFRTIGLPLFSAVKKGFTETSRSLFLTAKSFLLLFKGIDLSKAVSGPVRITYMLGDATSVSMGNGIENGIITFSSFLAMISLALSFMNLLPLPALDGGLILLFLLELIRNKPVSPKVLYYFQMSGMVIIFGLLLFSVFGDIMYFSGN